LLSLFFKKDSVPWCLFYIVVSVSLLYGFFVYLNEPGIGDGIPQTGLVRCIMEFFIGMCAWNIYKNKKNISLWVGYCLLLVYGVIFLAVLLLKWPEVICIPLAFFAFLLATLFLNATLGMVFLNKYIFVYLGEISYSIYLNHYLLRDLFKMAFLPEQRASSLWIISYLISVIVVSVFTYNYIENPLRYKIARA